MHLLNAAAPARDDGTAVDLEQTPGQIVILSMADSDLACLARARARLGAAFPSVRLANLLRLGHPFSVDLYFDAVLSQARLILVRLLGGAGYWRYGVERLSALRDQGVQLLLLGGEVARDLETERLSTLSAQALGPLHDALTQGGVDNAEWLLHQLAGLIGQPQAHHVARHTAVKPVPEAGVYRHLEATHASASGGRALVLCYRATVLAGDAKPVDALLEALSARGLTATALFVPSLKGAAAERAIAEQPAPDIIITLTGFTAAQPNRPAVLERLDCPILQAIPASCAIEQWHNGQRGLDPRDLAMQIALPEIDGRLSAGVVSFKQLAARDPWCQIELNSHAPYAPGIAHVAELAMRWVALRKTAPSARRVALILANYPNRDGRLGNGVGLDTPAASLTILQALRQAGYHIDGLPETSAELMAQLRARPTNDVARQAERTPGLTLSLADYDRLFAELPEGVRTAVQNRWGQAAADRHVVGDCFWLSGLCFGHACVMIQPARGYDIDPSASYHDPALVPPHHYFASYFFLKTRFKAQALLHIGKHGTLEWLPGKSTALSPDCFPQAVLGPMPHLYPFIVNDPGEGAQAKRRAGAVILDHLTPPLTRAASYGPLQALEAMIDEYYEASALDPRRQTPLAKGLLDLAHDTGLAADCGITKEDDHDSALRKLDGFLCRVKERQIRDGLHIFGISPEGGLRRDLAIAIARGSRNQGQGEDCSLLRALATDLDLAFDPLDADLATPWQGKRPDCLQAQLTDSWRTQGDTVERLEQLAQRLVAQEQLPEESWQTTRAVLDWLNQRLLPAIDACGGREIAGLLAGLAGRFVPPGPSGAPTRGRPEVLPTGRNFYSVDTRSLPTPTAWSLGWRSAQLLVERFAQDHGAYPRRLVLSAWGTSCMRTGGDDLAQALALMGVRPCWDGQSGRVSGFEIMPASLLDRPRVDVTLRISGFFRDAFPGLIDLFDRAVRAVASLDEPADINPLRASIEEGERLWARQTQTTAAQQPRRLASLRIFGAQAGSYGAGLQSLIDEGNWRERRDLAESFLNWGHTAYCSDGAGGMSEGIEARPQLEKLLTQVEAVVHNQDNHEHDILDSDDYYQFAGGLSATIASLSGQEVAVYHNDHSRPDAPRIGRLEEEIAMVVRARAANPKWIAGALRHGYKGAADMAATVDYLFAFAATTGLVADHHFDTLFNAYLNDLATVARLREVNPDALREMAARFDEAIARGLWQPRANHAGVVLGALSIS